MNNDRFFPRSRLITSKVTWSVLVTAILRAVMQEHSWTKWQEVSNLVKFQDNKNSTRGIFS